MKKLFIAILAIAFSTGFAYAAEKTTATKPTAAQCKKDPKMKGCADTKKKKTAKKPTAEQCKKDPKMKGCAEMK